MFYEIPMKHDTLSWFFLKKRKAEFWKANILNDWAKNNWKTVFCVFEMDSIGLKYLKFINHLWKHNADASKVERKNRISGFSSKAQLNTVFLCISILTWWLLSSEHCQVPCGEGPQLEPSPSHRCSLHRARARCVNMWRSEWCGCGGRWAETTSEDLPQSPCARSTISNSWARWPMWLLTNFPFLPKTQPRDFPGAPVAKTSRSQCRGPGFDPWSGN